VTIPTNSDTLVPGFDYFRCSVFSDFEDVAHTLWKAHGTGPVTPVKGDHGYGVGIAIPTQDRGTLHVLPPGQQAHPSVRVSGWPTDAVVCTLRESFPEGQASRVDARVDFVGDLTDWTDVLVEYAQHHRMRHAAYYVGQNSTGVELGAGKSESRTRCYDADLKHPGEFTGPTSRLEHEWKPQTRERKLLAYSLDAPTVLGTSRAASVALASLAGVVLPAAPARTERTSDFIGWLHHINRQADRVAQLLEYAQGDMALAMSWILDPSLAVEVVDAVA